MAPAKTAAKSAGTKVVDTTQPAKKAVQKSTKAQYRVLRPIRHGKIDLVVDDLVWMAPEDAQHLVTTQALAAHVTTQQVSRVVTLDGDSAEISAASAEVTGTEVAGQLAAPDAAAPAGTQPIAEVDNQGDIVLT